MSAVSQWLEDFRWAMNAMSARRFRRGLLFDRRVKFDAALRPALLHSEEMAELIAYPDAFYRVTIDDVIRAMEAAARGLRP